MFWPRRISRRSLRLIWACHWRAFQQLEQLRSGPGVSVHTNPTQAIYRVIYEGVNIKEATPHDMPAMNLKQKTNGVDLYRKEHLWSKSQKSSHPCRWIGELISSSNQGLDPGNVANRRQANFSLSLKRPSNLASKTFWLLRVSQTFIEDHFDSNFEWNTTSKKEGKTDLLKLDETTGMRPYFYPPKSTWSRRCRFASQGFRWNEPLSLCLVMTWWISPTKRQFHLPNNSWMITSVPTRLLSLLCLSLMTKYLLRGCCSRKAKEKDGLYSVENPRWKTSQRMLQATLL